MKKSVIISSAIIVAIALVVVFIAPKGTFNGLNRAGGGFSLKERNETRKTTVILQANQTNKQNLEQGVVANSYNLTQGNFFFNTGITAGISTQLGIVAPEIRFGAGADFSSFKLEYEVGRFKRTNIVSVGIDPQYSNRCIIAGESANVNNAMQLSLTKGGTRIGFGHQGEESFYDLKSGSWYGYIESNLCKWFSIAGGFDYNDKVSGYAAAKVTSNNNTLVLTANKLGTDNQNVIVTYNRSNISVMGNTLNVALSAWAKEQEQGAHIVAGLTKGKGTLYAELGSQYCGQKLTPYVGLGTSLVF